MGVISDFPLIDGPLAPLDHSAIVKLMAAVLIEADAFRSEADAMRALRPQFEMVEIIVHVDNARQYAMQSVVAEEMGKL